MKINLLRTMLEIKWLPRTLSQSIICSGDGSDVEILIVAVLLHPAIHMIVWWSTAIPVTSQFSRAVEGGYDDL